MVKEAAKNKDEAKKSTEVENKEAQEEEVQQTDKKLTDQEEKRKKKKARRTKKADGELEEQKIKYAELNDKYLRLFSEFDNFRKRNIKERLELTKTASEEMILLMLPIMDDFERAIKAFEEVKGSNSLKEGINLIYNKFKSTLTAKGIETIESKGKEFDTDYHEALTQIPAPSDDLKGKVIDEIEKGYLLNGKIIRFAKVVVGK
jgi:molecular chaperone GrpE